MQHKCTLNWICILLAKWCRFTLKKPSSKFAVLIFKINSQKNTFCTGFSTEFVLNTQTIWITNFRLHLRNPGGFWKYSRFSDRRPHLKFIGILQQKCTILIRNLTCGKKVSFAKIHLKTSYATKYFRRFAYLYFSNVRYLTSNWRLEVCKRLREI